MLANRAARGLASLRVQNNEMTLDEAGKFHAGWTPRGWSDAKSKLVGFEQLLYLRQPGYGPSYIVGIAARQNDRARQSPGRSVRQTFQSPANLRRHLGLRHRSTVDHRQRVPRAVAVKARPARSGASIVSSDPFTFFELYAKA
jgi:hypothetical protein